MSVKDVEAASFFNIPNSNCAICRARYQRIAVVLQGPNTTIVPIQDRAKSSVTAVVDVNTGVVASSQKLIIIKLQTCNDMSSMSSEGKVLGSRIWMHPHISNAMMATID